MFAFRRVRARVQGRSQLGGTREVVKQVSSYRFESNQDARIAVLKTARCIEQPYQSKKSILTVGLNLSESGRVR
jgi:hypothetical protein